VMHKWLPSVLQAVRPYFSPDDVSKGTRWSSEIAKELEASRVALIFITPENPEAPWLVFEAGALSKNLVSSRVCPLLFGDIEPTDIKGPLTQFQAAKFEKDEMRRVLKMINTELAEASLAPTVLDDVFEMWWPKLEQEVAAALSLKGAQDETARRPDRDLLEEILSLSRRNQRTEKSSLSIDHPAMIDLADNVLMLASFLRENLSTSDVEQMVNRVLSPLSFILRRSSGHVAGRKYADMITDLRREWILQNRDMIDDDDFIPDLAEGRA